MSSKNPDITVAASNNPKITVAATMQISQLQLATNQISHFAATMQISQLQQATNQISHFGATMQVSQLQQPCRYHSCNKQQSRYQLQRATIQISVTTSNNPDITVATSYNQDITVAASNISYIIVRPIPTNLVEFSGTAFQLVTKDFVKLVVQEMPKKSCDFDPIPTSVLYDCFDELIPIVTSIIDKSLSSGIVP